MDDKRVLIVDDEAAILSVLKGSLRKLGPGCDVYTALDAQTALEQLRASPFDLVITDYKLVGMNGLELIRAVKSLRPGTRTMLMTAYGNDSVRETARRLGACQYLLKPLEIDNFRKIVASALQDSLINRSGTLDPAERRSKGIVLALDRLRLDVGARGVLLADTEGNPIARSGLLGQFPVERVAPLLSGCMKELNRVSNAFDADNNPIGLAYTETSSANVFVTSVGPQLLLIVIVDPGPYNSKLGTVWNSTRRLASELSENLGNQDCASVKNLLDGQLAKAVGDQLDDLWLQPKSAGAGTDPPTRSEQRSDGFGLQSQNRVSG